MNQQRLQPFRNMFLQIGQTYFEFLPHPLFPDDPNEVFVLEGGSALVYKLRNIDTKELCALKVFKRDFRGAYIAHMLAFLAQYRHISVLHFSQRICLTKDAYPELILMYPELEYAILMPWLAPRSWAGLLVNPHASADYTREQALILARTTANALSSLEARGLAHTDISGSNLVPEPDGKQIHLLDIENMYIPGMPLPPMLSRGSPGYQHSQLGPHGQWCQDGDRFAGAVLLTEMLTWWNPRVRARVTDKSETLFRPEEIQLLDTDSWQTVRDTLYTLSPNLLELFDQAWLSPTLADCPPLSAWAVTLLSDFS